MDFFFSGSVDAEPASIADILKRRAASHPNRLSFTFLEDGEIEANRLTFWQLDAQARVIAQQLMEQGLAGERILLLYPQGLEFVAAFFGCLYAGAVAVPAYPLRNNRSMLRLENIVQDSQAIAALTTAAALENMQGKIDKTAVLEGMRWLTPKFHWGEDKFLQVDLDLLAKAKANPVGDAPIAAEKIAFLQYTSGSTGQPKGVIVSHGNIVSNEQMIQQAMGHDEDSVILGWLPMFHDMGLIGNMIQPIYVGAHFILMSPVAFLQRPIRWLKAISRYQANTSGAPNFAYELCVRKVSEAQRADLDLSSWTLAYNGAEPVSGQVLQRFAQTFADCGFKQEAFYPCYGMAETTLMVTGVERDEPPLLLHVNTDQLTQNRIVEKRASRDLAAMAVLEADDRLLVSCGQSTVNQRVLIVHPESHALCPPNEVGEIWVVGPNVAQGYWGNSALTKASFHAYTTSGDGPCLRTGDLGFLHSDELFVTGRCKDVIIIGGRNHYPQDIEQTVERSHPALRPGCGAAFSIERAYHDRLVVVQEVERTHIRDLDAAEVTRAVRQAVSQIHELQVHDVVLIKTGGIHKTSSGKIQRSACKKAYLEERFNVLKSKKREKEKLLV